ncbi:MAG: bifunctional folylpolyglutamate synthase/dihydrofolate synthase [Alphaproteobacteria bacterium]|nr:bifunctional folylpolyglutamate synthase/dihydrofolate synthase [Alphaproteobacteria bacterium]
MTDRLPDRPPDRLPDRESDRVLERLMGLHPKLIDLSLDRTVDLLERLGRPQDRLPPVVHVAGTNGKGSTSAFLRAMAEAAGLRVHVYSSPHLVRFAERIRLAGRIIEEEALTALLEQCEQVNENRPITFFEITTCAAFKAFSETPADLLILEVGMGGRLDSTNVVDAPAATAITPVSLDHEHFLGPGLARIAGEKAAIQKAGVPSIVGPQRPEALAVIEETAARVDAPLARWGLEWSVEPLAAGEAEAGRPGFRFASARWSGALPPPGLAGRHQIDNAGTAVALALTLADQGVPIDAEAIRRGVAAADWPARLQRLTQGPAVAALPGWEVRLDGGHNPSAGEALAAQAVAWAAADGRPLHLICGMLNSKAAADFLAPLAPHAASLTALAIPGEANSLSAEALAETARGAGFPAAQAAASLDAAVADLASRESAPARLLICGSLYLAGRVLAEHG